MKERSILIIRRIRDHWGLDEHLVYSVLFKLWGLVKSPLTIAVLIIYLNPIDQGFWYTFISLGTLTALAELGFTMVLTQLVSHEFAYLSFNGRVSGSEHHLTRLFALIRYSEKLYSLIIPIAFILLSIVGIVFLLSVTDLEIDPLLLIAWVLYSLSGVLTLITSILASIIQGLNEISSAQRILLLSSIISTLITIISLVFGLKLWALGIGGIANFLVCILFIKNKYALFFEQIKSFEIINKVEFSKNEIFSLQWKFAISWICGYLIYSLLTPLTMYYIGVIEAGKIGLSLSITRAVTSISTSWGAVQIPNLNMFASRKEFEKMDLLIKKVHMQSLSIFLLGACAATLVIVFIFPLFQWDQRIISVSGMIVLLISEISAVIIINSSYYLRAFKREPYIVISIFNAVISVVVVVCGLYFYHSLQMTILLFAAVQLGIMIVAIQIFMKKRKEYKQL